MTGFCCTMTLDALAVANFKNIKEARLEFTPNVNCLVGCNGMGKSNLLDAIHYLGVCRSFSGMPDARLVARGETFMTLRGDYTRRGVAETLTLGYQPPGRKSLKRGSKEYKRLADHIGLFPLVMSSPADTDLLRGPGEERRRWLDMVLSQADSHYLDHLVRYQTALTQRNAMLRQGLVDHTLYEAIEAGMAMAANAITATRREQTLKLASLFDSYYRAICGDGGETVTVTYSPSAPDGLEPVLASARRRDEAVGHTTVGPHRDDLDIEIDGMPMRRAGSQGQCKTLMVALRLAQFDYVRESTGVTPLLLLDDIFDKLDAGRVERIIDLVAGTSFGQIFITDTDRHHLDMVLGRLAPADRRLWTVEHGVFTQQS